MSDKKHNKQKRVVARQRKSRLSCPTDSVVVWLCLRCGANGDYPAKSPKNAVALEMDSCMFCDPYGEDNYRFYDKKGLPVHEVSQTNDVLEQ